VVVEEGWVADASDECPFPCAQGKRVASQEENGMVSDVELACDEGEYGSGTPGGKDHSKNPQVKL
jgi:hypothetical protein